MIILEHNVSLRHFEPQRSLKDGEIARFSENLVALA
jgi:hypothetical protein